MVKKKNGKKKRKKKEDDLGCKTLFKLVAQF